MARGALGASVMTMVLIGGVPSALAESRPIEELPRDIVRWSTMWMAIPQQMIEVGQEEGPLAALTWGPTKGTVKLIEATTKELWDVAKPDQNRQGRRPGENHSKGLILRYEF